jgi:hypothetical protein
LNVSNTEIINELIEMAIILLKAVENGGVRGKGVKAK